MRRSCKWTDPPRLLRSPRRDPSRGQHRRGNLSPSHLVGQSCSWSLPLVQPSCSLPLPALVLVAPATGSSWGPAQGTCSHRRDNPNSGTAILPNMVAAPPDQDGNQPNHYWCFAASDLYNWRAPNAPFSENPKELISLFVTIHTSVHVGRLPTAFTGPLHDRGERSGTGLESCILYPVSWLWVLLEGRRCNLPPISPEVGQQQR